jgi:hypothetical protein
MPTPYLPRVAGVAVLPALPEHLAFTQGNIFHVRPHGGAATNSGKSTVQGLTTLALAKAALTADQNDIVLMYAESNTAASTTDYQAATLDWSKDATHLIGVNAGARFSPRSRIAFLSTYDTASNLFTVSGNGCYFANLEFFAGVAGVNPTGCLSVTGNKNHFKNCHIAGIGNDANDIANAYSLSLAGSENYFEKCVIGMDTISRGTGDNAEIVLAGGARNVFEDCLIVTWAAVNTHQFLKRAASASDRFTLFKRCTFLNYVLGGGVTMLEALDVTAGGAPGGVIVLDSCTVIGAAAWEATAGASGVVYTNSPVGNAATGGVALAVTGA